MQLDPFQPERLRREVGQAVLGRLSEAEIADVVDGAIAHLRYEVVPAKAEMLQGDEYDRVAQHMNTNEPIAAISDSDVIDAVEHQLRVKEHRLAHVLYALAVQRRSDKKGREGWRTANDVLHWLYSPAAYPDVGTVIPHRADTEGYEWQPTKPASHPEVVVKRGGLEITIEGDGRGKAELRDCSNS